MYVKTQDTLLHNQHSPRMESTRPSGGRVVTVVHEMDGARFECAIESVPSQHFVFVRRETKGSRVCTALMNVSALNAMLASIADRDQARKEIEKWAPIGVVESAAPSDRRPGAYSAATVCVWGQTQCVHYWGGSNDVEADSEHGWSRADQNGWYAFFAPVVACKGDGRCRFVPIASASRVLPGAYRVGRIAHMGPEANSCPRASRALTYASAADSRYAAMKGVAVITLAVSVGVRGQDDLGDDDDRLEAADEPPAKRQSVGNGHNGPSMPRHGTSSPGSQGADREVQADTSITDAEKESMLHELRVAREDLTLTRTDLSDVILSNPKASTLINGVREPAIQEADQMLDEIASAIQAVQAGGITSLDTVQEFLFRAQNTSKRLFRNLHELRRANDAVSPRRPASSQVAPLDASDGGAGNEEGEYSDAVPFKEPMQPVADGDGRDDPGVPLLRLPALGAGYPRAPTTEPSVSAAQPQAGAKGKKNHISRKQKAREHQ